MSAAPPDDGSQDDSTVGGKRKGKVKVHHTVGKVVAATMVVIALVTGLGVVFLYRHSTATSTSSTSAARSRTTPPHQVPAGPAGPLNVLVMGSDNRDAPGDHIDNLTGVGKRSDTTILLHLSADRKRAYGVSIPRDSARQPARLLRQRRQGDLGGDHRRMWNDAFNVGGPACTIQQFEALTQVPRRPLRRRRLRRLQVDGRRHRRRRGLPPARRESTTRPHHARPPAPASSPAPRRSTTSASATSSATAPTSGG